MKEPRWIPENAVKAIQSELIAEHGGTPGILNLGQISSTLARPQNVFAYSDNPSLFKLAASYGYGFVKNHCFVDGNKRIAAAAIDVFLLMNGYELVAEEVDVVYTMRQLASSLKTPEEDLEGLTDWIERNSISRGN